MPSFSSISASRTSKFTDYVIEMDPNYPSEATRILVQKMASKFKIYFSCHVHSTEICSKIPQDFWPESDPNKGRLEHDFGLVLIWKPIGLDARLKFKPLKSDIWGEVNIGRYFCRLFGPLENLIYDSNQFWIDSILDSLHQISHSDNPEIRSAFVKELCLSKQRPKSLIGLLTLADLCFASIIYRSKKGGEKNALAQLSSMFVPIKEIKSR